MRVFVLAFVLALAGCGSDDTSSSSSVDLSQPVIDLSMPGIACGKTVCAGACVACIPFGGGVCGVPCKTSMPSTCAAGRCRAVVGDDGGVSGVTLDGSCAGFDGYCG